MFPGNSTHFTSSSYKLCIVTLPSLSSDDDEGEASHLPSHPSPSHMFTTNHSASSREDLEDETVSAQVQERSHGVGECHIHVHVRLV